MADTYKSVENRISETIHAINNGFYDSCHDAVIHYNVSVRRLQRRFKELNSKSTRSPTNRTLNDDQEKIILRYIDDLDHINMFFKRLMIVETVNYFLRHKGRQVHKH